MYKSNSPSAGNLTPFLTNKKCQIQKYKSFVLLCLLVYVRGEVGSLLYNILTVKTIFFYLIVSASHWALGSPRSKHIIITPLHQDTLKSWLNLKISL